MNSLHAKLCCPIEALLVSGSDSRSILDPWTGLNRFGCKPLPRPDVFSFSSSTATSISAGALCHVEAERERLLESADDRDFFDQQTERQRSELRRLLDLEEIGVEIVFSPSGTDAVLHALFLVKAMHPAVPLDCLLIASDETGSGVPDALCGQHFDRITAEGLSAGKGETIPGLSEGVTLLPLPMRDTNGRLHTSAEMDREVFDTTARSVASGHRVLLQAMDSSKLGVRCPSLYCLQSIQSRFADAVQIVVDACQMRCSAARLKWHLAQGHLVLISGSKFFTGPPFSGALLVPAALSSRAETIRQTPTGIQDYTHRVAWPVAWKLLRKALPDRVNFGQYFRWAAALDEMRTYASIPMQFRCAVLQALAAMTTELIHCRPEFHLLEEWKPISDRIDDAEMTSRTIFPFLLRQRSDNRWMSFEAATRCYAALNQDLADTGAVALTLQEEEGDTMKCQIGQPVSITASPALKVGALRLCTSARTVSDLWHRPQQDPLALGLEQETRAIAGILDKIALLTHSF